MRLVTFIPPAAESPRAARSATTASSPSAPAPCATGSPPATARPPTARRFALADVTLLAPGAAPARHLRHRPELRRPRARDRQGAAGGADRVHEAAHVERRGRRDRCAARRSSSGSTTRSSSRSCWARATRSRATPSPTTSPRATCRSASRSGPAPRAPTRSAPGARGSRPPTRCPTRRTCASRRTSTASCARTARTSDLIFGPRALVDFIAETITLEPGDLILTGTPSGVGHGDGPAALPRRRATRAAARSRVAGHVIEHPMPSGRPRRSLVRQASVRSGHHLRSRCRLRSVQDIALSGVIGALSYALDITEGQPAGHARPLLHDRDADRRGAPAAGPRPLRPLLRAAAQGRGLLRQRRAHGRAVRRRRPGGQAHVQARRLVEPRCGVPGRCGPSRPVAAARAGRLPAGDPRRGRRHPQVHGGALRPRRRDRAHALPHRTRPPPRSARSTSTGTGAGSPTGCAGEEIPLLARILCLAQTVEIFHASGGVKAARAVARSAAGRWFDPALVDALLGDLPRRELLGRARRARRVRAGSPRDLLLRRRRRAPGPDRRGVRARDRREVAVHRAPLRARRRDRRRDRRRARPRPPISCATCAGPACCTTSASSRSPT